MRERGVKGGGKPDRMSRVMFVIEGRVLMVL